MALLRIVACVSTGLALCAILATALRTEPRAAWESDIEASGAYDVCKRYVSTRLSNVSDNSFAIHNSVVIRKYISRRYAIDSYVQVDDPFGLPRRSYFFCVVQKQDEAWRLIYLETT